ncbi:hypothetical protein [Campylobacter corcagiensis]|uniref:OmpR/PhoB-type domain-containing protein n=1 Tax=Campylobacter corcagiensis TaxID=1448857 RepID=A0A7M1LEP9_9BACT|nr:hypothetical protein [Campylobacter corcagiensis]QKF64785.1 hypothetical protein CCORG_0932 [Campylobacter corcagiensis]QOQ87052.1 hypothetical protein IMC76_07515 [Campylobacter corcagiensis]
MNRFRNLNLMLVTNEKKLISKAKHSSSNFKNLYIQNSDDFISAYLNSNVAIDAVVLDLDDDEKIDLSAILYIHPNQQFIFLASKRQIYVDFLDKFRGGKSAVLFKPIKFSAILDNLTLMLKNKDKKSENLINLNDKISINLEKEKIYENGKEIFLTPMMHKLMLLLCANLDSLVTFEMIESSVYESVPNSRIVVQNLVGNLKRKFSLDIKSIYAKGYMLQSFQSQ